MNYKKDYHYKDYHFTIEVSFFSKTKEGLWVHEVMLKSEDFPYIISEAMNRSLPFVIDQLVTNVKNSIDTIKHREKELMEMGFEKKND